MTIEDVKKKIIKALENASEASSEFAEGLVSAYDGVLNLLADVEEPAPITEDEAKNHVIGIHNYCISKTDCKDCLFRGGEGICDFIDNYLTPSQWHIPPHWRDETDDK